MCQEQSDFNTEYNSSMALLCQSRFYIKSFQGFLRGTAHY